MQCIDLMILYSYRAVMSRKDAGFVAQLNSDRIGKTLIGIEIEVISVMHVM